MKKNNISIILITSLPIVLSIIIYMNYEKNYPYFHDVSSYNFINILVSKYTEEFGIFESFKDQFFGNNRNFLRVLPFIFFPELSNFKLSNLITSIPFIYIFVFKIHNFVCKDISDNFVKWFITFFIFFIPGVYNPVLGIVINWVDLNAALIISISAIYLFEWILEKKKISLTFFILFSFLTIYARFSSFPYYFIVILPIIFFHFSEILKNFSNLNRYDYFLNLSLFLVLLIYPLVHLSSVIDHYTIYGYGFDSQLIDSIKSLIIPSASFLRLFLSILLLIFSFYLFFLFLKKKKKDFLLFLILIAVVPILNIFIFKTITWPMFVYFVFASFISFLFFLKKFNKDLVNKKFKILCFIIIASFIIELILLNIKFVKENEQAYIQKNFDKKIGSKIANISKNQKINLNKENLVWLGIYDEHFTAPTLEMFYNQGEFIMPAGQDHFFSKHKSVFIGNYPDQDLDKIYDNISININNFVDILIVYADLQKSSLIHDNKFSIEISKKLSENIPKNKNWTFAGKLNSKKYGELHFYLNKRALPNNYLEILSGNADFK